MENIDPRKELRSIILRHFDSEKACAENIGWPRQRLSKILNAKKEPTVSEVSAMAGAVGETVERIACIFLSMWSPNG